MKLVKRRTGISVQPFRLEQITDKQIKAGLDSGDIVHVQGDIYEEVDGADQTYMTRDMAAQPKKRVARKKKVIKKTSDEEE